MTTVSRYNVLRLLTLLLLVTACSSPTTSPSPVATLITAPTTMPLIDNFDPPNPAWARFETEESAVYAQADELYLEDRGKGIAVYAPLAGKTYTDTVVSVQVRHIQGTVNNWMGVICRQLDEDNYYLLAISADGFYLILLVENGTATPLVGPKTSETIRTGKARNDLEVRCAGDALSLWVNDERLVTHIDDTLYKPGGVALFADAVERGETSVTAFDNFALTQP
ncbi:MAG: hypothetical protein JXR84_05640 [Anaerolineae bacterium]|nr:hypothetical protein [Anaerolineae bacterium]